MPLLVCSVYSSVLMLVLACIWACIDLDWIILVDVLASAMARIEKMGMYLICIGTYHYFTHTKYQRNTCQYMLICISMYC